MSEHLLLSSPFLLKSPLQSSSLLDSLPLDFRLLLSPPNQSHLFLLEPQLLSELAATQQPDFNAEDFRWRFSLPPAFRYRANSLTVGIFAEDVPKVNLSSLNWTEQKRIAGAYGPFNQSSTSSNLQFLQHAFYQKTITSKLNSTLPKNTTLHLHLVVLFPVRQLLWIGAIDEDTLFTLNDGDEENPTRTTVVHYGRTAEEIFDPFKTAVLKTDSKRSLPQNILVPDDIGHLLSQLPTARYLHCDPAKTAAWFTQYNQTENAGKVEASRRAISRMKSLMRRMRMQFWAVCGTLLGWYRQCSVTPYTTDTDFASWAKYVRAEAAEQEEEVNRNDKRPKKLRSLTELLKAEAAHHQLYLLNRFGEPWHSLEYSFATTGDRWEKADLFFVYPNRSHYLLPFHVPPQYAYSVYPRYGLCSGELLGFKVQVPCTPLEVITAEYGAEWQTPVSSWSYYEAPKNIGPLLPFAFANVSQHESFSE